MSVQLALEWIFCSSIRIINRRNQWSSSSSEDLRAGESYSFDPSKIKLIILMTIWNRHNTEYWARLFVLYWTPSTVLHFFSTFGKFCIQCIYPTFIFVYVVYPRIPFIKCILRCVQYWSTFFLLIFYGNEKNDFLTVHAHNYKLYYIHIHQITWPGLEHAYNYICPWFEWGLSMKTFMAIKRMMTF